MVTRQDFDVETLPTWCRGCGNHSILNAIKMALAERDIAPHQILFVTGVGCGSKLPHYMRSTGFHTLHGRTLAVASGARLANHGLPVITVHGDGDSWNEGMNHFVQTVRRNVNLVDVVQDNRIYGLTKGQYSPTSEQGKRTPTSPRGSIERPVNPPALALALGATFVSRGYSGELQHLVWLIGEALQHPGYALVDVLQPCVTWNRSYAYAFYKDRVYKLDEEEGYDPSDRAAAWEKAHQWGERIPIGIFYRDASVPSYEEQVPALEAGPLVDQPLETLTAEQVKALRAEIM
ncbi:MAG: 2-oxoacid:ferredoxin oxidoreductase subunit beta [Anaerolineae bacterium]|jgi:2-oxoglutarate ferredoxin oxidoreductase subunit beta